MCFPPGPALYGQMRRLFLWHSVVTLVYEVHMSYPRDVLPPGPPSSLDNAAAFFCGQ